MSFLSTITNYVKELTCEFKKIVKFLGPKPVPWYDDTYVDEVSKDISYGDDEWVDDSLTPRGNTWNSITEITYIPDDSPIPDVGDLLKITFGQILCPVCKNYCLIPDGWNFYCGNGHAFERVVKPMEYVRLDDFRPPVTAHIDKLLRNIILALKFKLGLIDARAC